MLLKHSKGHSVLKKSLFEETNMPSCELTECAYVADMLMSGPSFPHSVNYNAKISDVTF